MLLAAAALVSGIASGVISRRICKGGHFGEALFPAAEVILLKKRCALAGIEGHSPEFYGVWGVLRTADIVVIAPSVW
ncbi:hypothetical protein [Polaromonas sp. OV174]|uniref:hypothetical protein n=1 Tax=Polaromonas sp. OV174 TaxID=1855300 RepID=UPI001160D605|nr:hypothetical protein [Polaromonas sp. OV174]